MSNDGKNTCRLRLVVALCVASLLSWKTGADDAQNLQGPAFAREPPTRLDFMNNTGTVVPCSATGTPTPLVTWVHLDGSPLGDVSGLRHIRADGSLVFPPFSAEMFRQDVHDTVYKCTASNLVGSIASREVYVKAVVHRQYKVQVYDEFVVRGNTAVLRCQVPTFVQEYVAFVAWKRNDGVTIASTVTRGGRYSVLPTGELYIRSVTQADSLKKFTCQTKHRLSGDTVHSSSSGTLFVTEPHGTSPPKITDSRALVSAKEGETLELACAATCYPPPSYRWYKDQEGQVSPLGASHRITQLEGSLVIQYATAQDSGKYVCVVNNTVGESRDYTHLTVSAPLHIHVLPTHQTVDVGRSAFFNCSISGSPVRSISWYKDQRPLGRSDHFVFLSQGVLHIPSVQRDDQGMYQCLAQNDLESAQGTAQLRLGDVTPNLLSTFAGGAVRPGTSLSLHCSASGNPLPQITWSLDDVPVPDATRFRVGDFVTSDGHVISYVNVSDIRIEDGGDYSCIATNTLSQIRHSERIDVYGPPTVKVIPNITVVAGEVLELRCPISGYPIDSIMWRKDGTTLPSNHRQKVDKVGNLVIQDVQRSAEEGTFICEAIGQGGKASTGNLHVKVIVAPKVDPVTLPETVYVNEGQKFKLLCNILEGDPPIQTSWMKNGEPITLDDVIKMQSIDDSAILIFKRIGFRHRGNYTCVASNYASSINRTARLVVNVPPRWMVEPNDDFVVLGQRILMGCMADGFPRPRIYWKKAKGKQASEFKDVLSSYQRQVFDNGTLVIQEVEEDDSGHYLCQAVNGIGVGLSKVVFLTIHTPPRFETKFVSHTVAKGHEAYLRCEARGQLPINIKWEKDKQPFESHAQQRILIKEETGTDSVISVLAFHNSLRSDSSLYTCIASNKFGTDETNIQLVVQEAPSPPTDLTVKEKTSRSVTLSWAAGFTGNSPLTKYTLLKYGNGTSIPDEEGVEQVELTEMDSVGTIQGLLPAGKYRFKVMASNALGNSEPSKAIELETNEEVPGGPPLSIDVKPTGSQSLKVTWKPPRADLQHGKIQGYYIGYKISGTDDQYQYKNVEALQQQLSYLTNLRRLTSYKVIVQAYNGIGAGPRSDEVTATTLEAAPPTSPVLSTNVVTSTSVTVKWERHSDDTMVRDYILHYKAEGDTRYQQEKISTNQSEHKLYGLKCGTRYRLYMTASNSVGMGEPRDTISVRTNGAAPVSPPKETFLTVNTTTVTLNFKAWQSGGCPILYFSVHFRDQGQWKAVAERIDSRQSQLDVRHLAPSREYTLRVSAYSDAGTTEAEYRFHTLNLTIPTSVTRPHSPVLSFDGIIPASPFYKNLTILLPVIISIIVLLVVIITVALCLRKQADTNSMSGELDSHKGRNPDNMGLSEFSAKSMKEPESYGKSSYYSSPARKSVVVASSLQRGILDDTCSALAIKNYSGWS